MKHSPYYDTTQGNYSESFGNENPKAKWINPAASSSSTTPEIANDSYNDEPVSQTPAPVPESRPLPTPKV